MGDPLSIPKNQNEFDKDRFPWSPEAIELLKGLSADFGDGLFEEAVKLANREELQQVGTPHVQEARRRVLAQRKGGWFKTFAGTLGGLFLGCMIGMFVDVIKTGTISIPQIAVMLVLTGIGTGCAIYHALK